jgi:hypothetical protein
MPGFLILSWFGTTVGLAVKNAFIPECHEAMKKIPSFHNKL